MAHRAAIRICDPCLMIQPGNRPQQSYQLVANSIRVEINAFTERGDLLFQTLFMKLTKFRPQLLQYTLTVHFFINCSFVKCIR